MPAKYAQPTPALGSVASVHCTYLFRGGRGNACRPGRGLSVAYAVRMGGTAPFYRGVFRRTIARELGSLSGHLVSWSRLATSLALWVVDVGPAHGCRGGTYAAPVRRALNLNLKPQIMPGANL